MRLKELLPEPVLLEQKLVAGLQRPEEQCLLHQDMGTVHTHRDPDDSGQGDSLRSDPVGEGGNHLPKIMNLH